MTTTMADMVADAKRMTYGSLPEQINLIGVASTAGATTLTLQMPVDGIVPGTILSSGLNVWYVRGVTTTGNIVSVIPGYSGAPKNATLVDDFVYIRPRITDWYVFTTLNDVIKSLSAPSSGLYKVGSWQASVDTTTQTYAIPTEAQNMVGLIRARVSVPGYQDVWQDIPSMAIRVQSDNNVIRFTRNLPGSSLVEFIYKSPFTEGTDLTDNVETVCGLAPTMLDIPPLGATVTMLRTTESRRSQIAVQSDPRRAEEVAMGANSNAAREFARDFKGRVDDEYARLLQRNPLIRSI